MKVTSNLEDKDYEYFIKLFEFNISTLYPYSSKLTAQSIIDIHKSEFDPNGYFTKKKTLWKLIDDNNQVVGFSVVTEKRGGSVKFGPTIVAKDHRNQGYGSTFRMLLEKEYQDLGYRKSYLTTNSTNTSAFSYLLKMGYKIELHLKQHYTTKDDEIVLSKFLDPINPALYLKEDLDDSIIRQFPTYVLEYLNEYYEEINNDFYTNLARSISHEFIKSEESFIRKTKVSFENRDENFFAITSPKRGGCIKISPLVLSGNYDFDFHNINQLVNFFDRKLFHKFYTFIPINRIYDRELLEDLGFIIEGVFREPYKKGIDMFIVSHFSSFNNE